jgi:hypothetical protein
MRPPSWFAKTRRVIVYCLLLSVFVLFVCRFGLCCAVCGVCVELQSLNLVVDLVDTAFVSDITSHTHTRGKKSFSLLWDAQSIITHTYSYTTPSFFLLPPFSQSQQTSFPCLRGEHNTKRDRFYSFIPIPLPYHPTSTIYFRNK